MHIISTPVGYHKVIGSLIDGRLFTVPCDMNGHSTSLIPVILTAAEPASPSLSLPSNELTRAA